MAHCPLCLSSTSLEEYFSDNKRVYMHCSFCDLVSVPDNYHLSTREEKVIYDLHQNESGDLGYRAFLSRTLNPLIQKLDKNAFGLDFGCGPGPTISKMAEEQDIKVYNYDPYYFNRPELLLKQYDFITMTEVIEHITDPLKTFELLNSLLKPKAILAIMTKRVTNQEKFKTWHYKNDPTHIRFYSIKVFQWIAKSFNWQLEVVNDDVVFLINTNEVP